MRRVGRTAVAAVGVLVISGGVYVVLAPNELQRAASEAKRYPFVLDADYLDGGRVIREDSSLEILVDEATTDEQAAALWCEVIVPHGGDRTNASVETMDGRAFPPVACPVPLTR